MALYKKEGIDELRSKIDLVDVLSGYLPLKRSGASYKGLCPFHDEKTPSFIVHKGDTHYHCFGCGAHGDAIAFLMSHVKMSFMDAVRLLADKFGVLLEEEEGTSQRSGPSKRDLKEVLEKAASFFSFMLLYTEEGKEALSYLYARGLDLEFIQAFGLGFAPEGRDIFYKAMKGFGFSDEVLIQAGLISFSEGSRKRRDFFADRITFPIRDPLGGVIGFSARKYREETFGGKYVNTPETPLFKKSRVLFGLSYCRRRIAKEQRAIVVEGQIDALRLIHAGFTYTVAGQGTAFGSEHVKELVQLGVKQVFLALDGDAAGQQAMVNIGDLFQRKGVEVKVVPMPQGCDPDLVLRKDGAYGFLQLLDKAQDYLTFVVAHLSKSFDLATPSGKNELAVTLVSRIREWDQPVLVHESLKRLSELLQIPEEVLGIQVPEVMPIKRYERVAFSGIDPGRILETDLLRWLFLGGESGACIMPIVERNIAARHFRTPVCQKLFTLFLQGERELLSLSAAFEGEEEAQIFSEILGKKINTQKAESGVHEAILRLLQREWMEEREEVKNQIQSGQYSEEETSELVKRFDEIKKRVPSVL